MVRYGAIYDFPATQVGDHSMGRKSRLAELTGDTENFVQDRLCSHTNLPAGEPFGLRAISRA